MKSKRKLRKLLTSDFNENRTTVERIVAVRRDGASPEHHWFILRKRCDECQINKSLFLLRISRDGSRDQTVLLLDCAKCLCFSHCAVDEIEMKIYLTSFSFETTEIVIEVFPFELALADANGFRSIIVGARCKELRLCDESLSRKFSTSYPLMMLPNGQMVWWLQIDHKNRCHHSASAVLETLRHQLVTFAPDSEILSCSNIFTMPHFPRVENYQFFGAKHQLVVHCVPQNMTETERDWPQLLLFDVSPAEFSTREHPELSLQLTPDLINDSFHSTLGDLFKRRNSQFLGRAYKYWFFAYAGGNSTNETLAIRLGRGEKDVSLLADGEELRQVIWRPQERPVYKKYFQSRIVDFVNKNVQLENKWVHGESYFGQFSVNSDHWFVVEVPLPVAFKDPRVCANCKRQETHKRQNSQGQRTADFKVCRNCKSKKLHLRWWQWPCHFCSRKCVVEGWKEHRQLHDVKA